jgi:hypothetical protein
MPLFLGPNFSQRTVDFLFCVLTNTARVVEQTVCVVRRFHDGVSVSTEIRDYHLAVQHIHLAADRLDVNPFIHHAKSVFSEEQAGKGGSIETKATLTITRRIGCFPRRWGISRGIGVRGVL